MDDATPARPEAAPDWSFPDIPPQRYGANREKYLSRGGMLRVGALARRYSDQASLPDPNRFFFLCHVFDQIEKEALGGDFVELGVYRGDTAALLSDVAIRLGKTAYLLDTFAGFDSRDFSGIDDGRGPAFADTSLDSVRARIGEQNTVYIKGYFPDTAKHLPDQARYALVHIDCDLHQPILGALEYFYPRMVPGGFIIVHDYNSLGWDGAEKAVDEFFMDRPESIVPVPDSSGSAVIRKARAANGADNWRAAKKSLSPGAWLSAANGGLATYLDDGWSASEDWGIWGVGDSHVLSFVFVGPPSALGYKLDIDVHAALIGTRTEQVIDITVNNIIRSTYALTLDENRGVRSVPLPETLRTGTLVSITLAPRSTESLRELEVPSSDTRRLGTALHRIRLTERDVNPAPLRVGWPGIA